eukprot:TRINITY_DN1475_c0_g4_i1.p1 TRINITY_DN1475_c0_g4~~TRINITY_DN1475_c0_g4_i1.p1  ORF type:complete len:598 (+),score=113.79 TRINITY_DN1475_c0_g4_i1:121-1794(+)
MTLAMMSMRGTPRSARSDATVPFLPGMASHGATPRHKAQTLGYGPGGALDAAATLIARGKSSAAPPALPKIDMDLLKVLQDPTHRYNYSARSLTHDEREAHRESARNTFRPEISPAWLKHDRQVLRFFAYFQEAVHEDPKENSRVRNCVLYFYLEDGTIMISEPKIVNSGIPQGTFVKRHRIPRPGGGFYTAEDFRNGIVISIYSRAFKITGCDDFTRAFYETALGVDVGENEVPPEDPFCGATQDIPLGISPRGRDIAEGKEYNELALGGNRRNAKLQQYLENDRRVLCFRCYWDDPSRYGSRMYYTLHYYLADDSVEILECLARNSGRDPYPVFWRRAPLPKNPHVNAAPGMLQPDPVLYKPEDMFIGGVVHVYGREVFLYDCDAFTKEFYRQYTGHEQESIPMQQPETVQVVLADPPYTGFGTEEDSLASCRHLTPRPPRKDYTKMLSDMQKVLRFEAKMVTTKADDVKRRFIVAVYVADGEVGIWEVKCRNSGHTEGKFASKSRKKNPRTGTWFQLRDFVVGDVVEVNAVPFELLKADDYTQSYMEQNPQDFA